MIRAAMNRRRAAGPGHRRLILLVESDPAVARVLARALAGRRTVVIVEGIEEALDALEPAKRFDAMVTSARLRDGTALRLLRTAKRRCPQVLRILYIDPEGVRPALAASADRVVLTTASFDDLRAAVGP
jgi:CheY-like chemotaxis protein